MATFAPPVRRDKFLYSSLLYADAGNDNHHPRATVAQLTALLRPEAPAKTKKKTVQPPPEPLKDQVGHWYTAQLIHYGLLATKDKNAAKVRLLNALNEGKLEVPGWITKLESELKKEWEAENRKLKKAAKGGDSGNVQTTKTAGAKRKRGETNGPGTAETEGRPKAKPKSKSTNIPAKSAKMPTSSAPKAGNHSLDNSRAPNSTNGSGTSTKRIIPYYGPHRIDFYPGANHKPSAYPFSGAYRVSCAKIEDDWPGDSIDEFYLDLSPLQDQLWGRFKWGNYQGIIMIGSVPKTVPNKRGVTLKWRARRLGGLDSVEGCGKAISATKSAFKGELHDFFHLGQCDFEATEQHLARSGGKEPSRVWFTTVATGIQEEWAQMDSVMGDANWGHGSTKPSLSAILPTSKPRAQPSASNTNARSTKKPQTPAKKSSTKVKLESSDTNTSTASITISGTYQVSSEDVGAIYGVNPDDLELTLCKDAPENRWWAFFAWGPLDGLIQLSPGPDLSTIDEAHSLGWRIRNSETGRMEFGRGCTGVITFGRYGSIQGTLYNVEGNPLVFSGTRLASRGPPQCHPDDISAEWDDFPRQAYGRD